MSRNSSGTYTLPAGNPVVTDTVIESAWANSTMEDIGNELTSSLDRNGKGGMLAPLLLTDGTENLPAVAFVSDQNSGLYKAAAGDYRLSLSGSDLIRYAVGKMTVTYDVGTAVAGPDIIAHRDSPTPAASDLLGRLKFDGEDSADNQDTYAQISATLVDPTATTEDGSMTFWTMQNGTLTAVMFLDEVGDVEIFNNTTIGGNTTIDGSSTVGGNLTVTGDTVLGDTVTVGGEPLSSFVGSVPLPTKHRYWRLTVDEVEAGGGTGELRLNEFHVFSGGLAYVNGQRWEPGTDITSEVSALTGAGSPGTGTRAALIDGNDASFGASFPNAVANGVTFIFDFGADNDQRVTSIQQVPFVTDDDWISGFTMAYSDDAVSWTDVGTFTELPGVTAATASDHYTLTEQVQTYEPDELKTYPEVTAGGSTYWSFVGVVEAENFTAVAGNYYLIPNDAASTLTVTLPASPSQDDRVGIRREGSGTTQIDRNGSEIEGSTAAASSVTVGVAAFPQNYVELIYKSFGPETGWFVINGAIEVAV